MKYDSSDSSHSLDEHVKAYKGNSLYDFDNSILLNWYPRRILELTPGRESLLELGLGHGISTPLFSKEFSRHVVIEGSPAVIKHFHKINPACSAEILEVLFENFTSERMFDSIVMGFVLEHVKDPKTILRQFKRFLTKGGSIFIAVPNAEAMNRRLGTFMGVLSDLTELSQQDRDFGHRRYYTCATLGSELIGAGLKIKKLEGIYLKPFTTRQIQSLQLPQSALNALCEIAIGYPELSLGILAEATVD